MGTTTWSDEKTEELKRLVARELSASQIGAQLGVTRNAVIGKLARIGVALMGVATRPKTKHMVAASVTRKIYHRKTPARLGPPKTQGAIVPLKIALFDLKKSHCRWVLDEKAADGGFLFCGNEKFPGRSYCFQHCCVVYNDMRCEFVASASEENAA